MKSAKELKDRQNQYLTKVMNGFCAVCEEPLEVDCLTTEVVDSMTCSECETSGFGAVFRKGVLVGMKLKELKCQKK